MSDLESFRSETRAWLEANAPKGVVGFGGSELEGTWGGRKAVYTNPDMKVWLDVMGEKGWTAPTWPTEYGGGGLSKDEEKVLRQEMKALKLPPPLIATSVSRQNRASISVAA